MELLDLPPEIFQRIIEIYVTTFGIRKAAKAREVSKTFRSYINEEIFARQPTSVFKGNDQKEFLRDNLAFFLTRRMVALHGAPDILPSYTRRLVNHFMLTTGAESEQARINWERRVTLIIATHDPSALRTALAPAPGKSKQYQDDPVDDSALIIAIHLRRVNVFTQLLAQGADPWGKSAIFAEHAISLAARTKNSLFLEAILSAAEKSQSKIAGKRRSVVLRNCIQQALTSKRFSLAVRLLTWYTQSSAGFSVAMCSDMVELAVASDALDFVKALQNLNCLGVQKHQHTQSIVRGLMRNQHPRDMLDHLYVRRFSKFSYGYRLRHTDQTRYLLDIAVYKSNLFLAEAILELDNAPLFNEAFREAISKNDLPMVQLLLRKGADPEARSRWSRIRVRSSTCELARPGSKVYSVVRKAIEDKTRRLGTDYQVPQYTVWDTKKQKDVYVAYTFHAPEL